MNSLSPEQSKLVDFITKAYPMPAKMASEVSERFYPLRINKGDFLLKEGSVSNEYVFLTEGYMRSFATDPDGNSLPPHFALAIGPPVIFITYLAVFRRKMLVETSSSKHLTLLHTIRIAVELVLFCLFQMGEIPKLMTFEGSNPDILSGITAPLIWLAYQKGLVGNRGLLVWNIVCLGLLLNIVVRAILSAPTPLQQFAFDQPNVGILKAPYVLLPAFIVPAVLFSHVAAILKLSSGVVASLRDLR